MSVLDEKRLCKEEIIKKVGNISQIASARRYKLQEGKADGIKGIDVVNGSGLSYTVLEGKCLDIFKVNYKGINLSFVAKPDLVASEYFNPINKEFLRAFQGGMLYTCGLLNVGTACNDNGIEHSIHGRIGSTPAENVNIITQWKDNEYIIDISGSMKETSLFGENMQLSRKISTTMGSKTIKITDVVENLNFSQQEYMLLYHINFGYPLLDENSEFIAPIIEVCPRDDEAAKGASTYSRFGPPIDDFKEQVFYHTVAANEAGYTYVAVINEKLKLGMYIKYNIEQLPRLIQWKSQKSGDYAMGIEPANCLVEGRVKEKERGTIKKLAALDSATFDIELGIIEGIDEIDEFKKMVMSLV